LNRKFNDLDESFPPSTLLMNNLLSNAESRLIVVMQQGEIIETGKHADLIEQKGVYHKLSEMQAFV
jgi:subfamily B ATP-binding cassette protein MsbA